MRLKEAFENGLVVPHKDIIEGRISENSFAVSFFSFLEGKADRIYQDPDTFFNLTYMTQNLKGIFNDVLNRLGKGGARPLLVIDTTFGGGKTHTLVGLYHLFKNGESIADKPQVKEILNELGLEEVPEVAVVAIDCHSLSSLGEIKTLWGEIGKQLGCYELVEEYDKRMRRPTDAVLRQMIESAGKPVLILIDELVNYLKDARGEEFEVGGTTLAEITVSFLHTITEVVANTENDMLIITLPGEEPAYMKEAELLEEYKNVVKSVSGRESAFAVPLRKEDIYEIARRRLFVSVDGGVAKRVAEELQEFYASYSEFLPEGINSPTYYEKLARAYPFHPLFIDILYERVSTISDFQKTRGVLRLLAHVLKSVYQNREKLSSDIVITPGINDLLDNGVFQELTNKIGRGEFQNVIRTDIVNEEGSGRAQSMDAQIQFGGNVRVATSIYLYTLIGATKELSKGGTIKDLALAASVPLFLYPADIEKVVENLDKPEGLWYIYEKAGKWYFDVEPNVNKIIYDAKSRISKPEVREEIKKRLRSMFRTDIFDVRIWEEDVRNPVKPTLVVCDYDNISASESEESAPEKVRDIIVKEGTSYRTRQNLMFVLVPRKDRVERMAEGAKKFLAIKEIKSAASSKSELKTYRKRLEEDLKEADSNLNTVIELCYSLIYYPFKTEVKHVTVQEGYKGAKNLPEKVYIALRDKARKIVEKLDPEYIKDEVLKEEKTFKEIFEVFQEAPSYPLPKNKQVLADSVNEGVEKGLFAVYIGGIGDLEQINIENYKRVGSNFYFGRRLEEGPKDAHYLILKDKAEEIEKKLKKVGETVIRDRGGGGGFGAGGDERVPSTVTVEDFESLSEHVGAIIENLTFKLKNSQSLQSIGTKLTLLTIGVTDLKVSAQMKGENMELRINNAEIRDMSKLTDVLHELSNIVQQPVEVGIDLKYENGFELSEDEVETLRSFEIFKGEMSFKAKLRKES